MDFEKFRLRPFIDRLIEIDEVEVHDQPVPLAGLSAIIEASPKATLFRNAGPERLERVAAVSGGRRRLAAAFGVDERELPHEYMRRLADPQPMIEVASSDAPVHQVVRTGDDIDLTRLPFHVQHEFDGRTYITSGIDYMVDPATGRTNVGCRRLMLRNRDTMRANLTDLSDLKRAYLACLERGEGLQVNYAIGSSPLDFLSAGSKAPVDEFGLVGTLRGEPVPMVPGVTNGVPAPADAEMVIEGYYDELGYREMEGPYGEFYGFYGPPHIDPVYHVTAITLRSDVLYQTMLHAGRNLSRTDSGNLGALNGEINGWRALRAAHIEPVAVRSIPATNGRQNLRVALPRTGPGVARPAIEAVLAIPYVKHCFVVDDDVDIFSDEQVEWAMATRFRADRDLVVETGHANQYMDPLVEGDDDMTKAGFDLTAPYGRPETVMSRMADAPRLDATARFQTVRMALDSGPMFFAHIMAAVGSDDGREVALELDALREEGVLARLENGEWKLEEKQHG